MANIIANIGEELNTLASKSGRSRKAAESGAALLLDEFSKQRDCALAAEYLRKFHYSVCIFFIKNANLTGDEARQIALLWTPQSRSQSKPQSKLRFSAEFAFCRGLIERGYDAEIPAYFAVGVIRSGTSENVVGRNGFLAAMIGDFKKVFHSADMREKFAELAKLPECGIIATFANEAQGGDISLMELSELRRRLTEAQSEIDSLNERLEQSFKMDAMRESTALETLKKSVSESLKEEYDEYQRSDHTFNEDNFAANRASLIRIFKILKRFGFSFE